MCFFFFFNDTATTEIYTLSLHDALPICGQAGGDSGRHVRHGQSPRGDDRGRGDEALRPEPARDHQGAQSPPAAVPRSEEHTSELQSRPHLVCRLLLEKKKDYVCVRISAL